MAPPPAIETAAAATDQLPAALSGTLAPAKSVPELLTVADALFHTMGSADLSMRIMVNPFVHL